LAQAIPDKHMSSATPSRAVHIGSLLRPKALFEKRLQLESKQCTPAELKSVEDAAIKHVLDLQRNVGLKIFSDGELRRFLWISTVML
jgi:methionine synthase II (cobalamin-independent)